MKARRAAALGLVLGLCVSLYGCSALLNALGRGEAVRAASSEPPSLKPRYEDYGKCQSFTYGFGDFSTGYREYSVFPMEGRMYFRAEGSNGADLNVLAPVEAEVLNELDALIAEHEIYGWNGFYSGSGEVPNGKSFTLRVEYENADLAAAGYAQNPDNYEAGHKALATYLAKLAAGLPPKQLGPRDEILELTLYMKTEDVSLNFNFEAESAEYRHVLTRAYDYAALDPDRLLQFKYDAVDAYNRGREVEVPPAYEETIPLLSLRYRLGTAEGAAELGGAAQLYDDSYEALRGQAMALLGLPANFTEGEAYQDEAYRGQFRNFQKIMLYDAGRRNYEEIIIDLPEKSMLIGGRAHTIQADIASAFYRDCLALQANSFIEQGYYSHLNLQLEEYVKGDSDARIFREHSREGLGWLLGVSNGWQVQLYGGAEYAHDWESLAESVDALIASARRVGYRPPREAQPEAPPEPPPEGG